MSKKSKILVIASVVIASLLIILISFFQITKSILISEFNKENTSESLYDLCKYSSSTNNHDKIVEYYHKLLISGTYDFNEITSIPEKEREDTYNYMIYEYMLSCEKVYKANIFAEKIAEAFTYYHFNADNPLTYTHWVISEYYGNSGDSQTVLYLYDLLFEKSVDLNIKYDVYSMKYRFVAFELGELEKAKQEMLPELNRLYSEYEKEQS